MSGLSTDTLRGLDGSHRIGFSTSRFALNIGVGTTGTTGIVTSIDVIGDFSPQSVSANDILSLSGIGSTNGLPLTENMLVLNVDSINSKLRVQREFNGVVGVAHSEGQAVTATNRSITFNLGLDSDVITNVNVPYYFNPIESVALGSTAGVGVGSTVVYTYKVSGNGISSTFVPTQQIFLFFSESKLSHLLCIKFVSWYSSTSINLKFFVYISLISELNSTISTVEAPVPS